jgi:hypothetical protein
VSTATSPIAGSAASKADHEPLGAAPHRFQQSNLVVLGASGRTGRLVVEQALAAGHFVTALVRSPEKLTLRHPKLRVVVGDATDPSRCPERSRAQRPSSARSAAEGRSSPTHPGRSARRPEGQE